MDAYHLKALLEKNNTVRADLDALRKTLSEEGSHEFLRRVAELALEFASKTVDLNDALSRELMRRRIPAWRP